MVESEAGGFLTGSRSAERSRAPGCRSRRNRRVPRCRKCACRLGGERASRSAHRSPPPLGPRRRVSAVVFSPGQLGGLRRTEAQNVTAVKTPSRVTATAGGCSFCNAFKAAARQTVYDGSGLRGVTRDARDIATEISESTAAAASLRESGLGTRSPRAKLTFAMPNEKDLAYWSERFGVPPEELKRTWDLYWPSTLRGTWLGRKSRGVIPSDRLSGQCRTGWLLRSSPEFLRQRGVALGRR